MPESILHNHVTYRSTVWENLEKEPLKIDLSKFGNLSLKTWAYI